MVWHGMVTLHCRRRGASLLQRLKSYAENLKGLLAYLYACTANYFCVSNRMGDHVCVGEP